MREKTQKHVMIASNDCQRKNGTLQEEKKTTHITDMCIFDDAWLELKSATSLLGYIKYFQCLGL